ncbi:MAG: glycosyl hydrolase, partial [Planctomycetota bacterium]
ETGIFKTTDGGEHWTELTNGLPGGDMGKISLQVSPQKSNYVYATIELPGRKGGFWRSDDHGASWTKTDDFVSGGTGPHYYQELWADPHRFGVLYQANNYFTRSEDNGETWINIEGNNKHVDNHAVAFHPTDKDFLLVGCDGGVYRSYDYCNTWLFCPNLPLTQFYKVSVDNDYPFYNIAGGTQDNNSQYGPSRTKNTQGIRNSDWRITIGGDGHDTAIDPKDPNIIYAESQQGFLRRFDRRTGESVMIQPQPGPDEESFRFNWDTPILISPHDNKRLYFASQFLHRSDDRGDSWQKVSPDLSKNRNRYALPTMGRVHSIDAGYDLYAMSQHSNITSIAESPLVEGLLYVGTDDGLIQISEDGGENWRRVERIFDIPENFFVNDIKADLHDADTVYACIDDHKTGDYRGFVVKSTDRGRTWSMMTGNLPENHICWRIVQDHVDANLFFLATEFGIFATRDGGDAWFKLGNSPTDVILGKIARHHGPRTPTV